MLGAEPQDALVLKKDVAGLHGMSWEEFVQSASSRIKKRQCLCFPYAALLVLARRTMQD